ncbi:MAG: hypothetical protein ACREFR_09015 [Limisphaerales bacterium]
MKRRIKSFEAEADVGRMLVRAQADGMKLGKMCNEALRRLLREKGYGRKKDLAEPGQFQ